MIQINSPSGRISSIDATPHLTDAQKAEMKSLMDKYLAKTSLFVYDGSFRRESYAYPNSVSSLDSTNINGCKYNDKYIINCSLFAQFIWMGRNIEDFTSSPTTNITKAFDWGYYFDFRECKVAYGVMKGSSTYYSANTYVNDSGNKSFITFDNAAAMGSELYRHGYEIPYGDVEVGDLVFYRSDHISDKDNDGLEQSSFRYITHVAVVYDVKPEGPIMAESTNAWTAAVGKFGLSSGMSKFAKVRAAGEEQRVVMAARHPAAYGNGGNVPSKITTYRGSEASS